MQSKFNNDLAKELLLHPLLNKAYERLEQYTFKRSADLRSQHQGIDVILTHKKTGNHYFIDEKAQLDYIDQSLPTFAFELVYQKKGQLKMGWLFDPNKKTDFYALATSIFSDEQGKLTSCRLTFVNRKKLLTLLNNRGLDHNTLLKLARAEKHGRILLDQLDPKQEGYLYYSTKNKVEQPLNLILKLDWLVSIQVAK